MVSAYAGDAWSVLMQEMHGQCLCRRCMVSAYAEDAWTVTKSRILGWSVHNQVHGPPNPDLLEGSSILISSYLPFSDYR
jgi:hypothetical protein